MQYPRRLARTRGHAARSSVGDREWPFANTVRSRILLPSRKMRLPAWREGAKLDWKIHNS
jgi:hypothetical protein